VAVLGLGTRTVPRTFARLAVGLLVDPGCHDGAMPTSGASSPEVRDGLFIGGRWRPAVDAATRTIRCPADGVVVGEVAEASAADVALAVEAASTAFELGGSDRGSWRRRPPAERAAVLVAAAGLLDARLEDVARLESLDTGKRITESRTDVSDSISSLSYYVDLGSRVSDRVVDTGHGHIESRVVAEPVGVCALITPWNYPLVQAMWKVAPALMAGNSIVIKPSELTPHTTIELVRVLDEAGVPGGVVNLVTGTGAEVGDALVRHPGVDLVSFTGGLATGRTIMAAAAATVKNVALELGGKNPNIVFADADLDAAVDLAVAAAFYHSGQVCSAGTRLLVEDPIRDEFVDAVVARAEAIRLGGPFDEAIDAGTLISEAHLAKVERYVSAGVAEGAVLRCGGRRLDRPGSFYPPTVLDRCTSEMSVVQDESFGPVLTVEVFGDEAEAVALANDTIYGLAGAVWTGDPDRADRVAAALRHGTVWINDFHPYVPEAEWGGFKQSGVGRELGPHGLAEYTELKHIWRNTDPRPQYHLGERA